MTCVFLIIHMWKTKWYDLCLLPEPADEEDKGDDEEEEDEHQWPDQGTVARFCWGIKFWFLLVNILLLFAYLNYLHFWLDLQQVEEEKVEDKVWYSSPLPKP